MSSDGDCCGDSILEECPSSTDCEDANLLQDYIHASIASKVLYTACEMNIFDVLAESKVALCSEAVAEAMGASVRGTQCLLDACVGLKLLETDFQNGEVFYKNTKLSRCYLTKTSSKSMISTLMFFSSEVYPALISLKECVREGVPLISIRNNAAKENEFFKHIFRSEDKLLQFIHHMDSSWALCDKEETISSFDLSDFKIICDLGGCSGTLAKVCGAMYPASSIIVYDLPEIIQATWKHFKIQGDSNISFVQGNFYEDPIPDADLYILARVMHDWGDESCLKVLKKVYMTCKPGGGVFIIEGIMNEDRTGPAVVHLQNVVMLMFTEGKERTNIEYKALLETAGFKDIQFCMKRIMSRGILARK